MAIELGITPILDPTRVFSVHKASNVLGWLKGLDPRGQRTRRAREDVSVREIARALKREKWNVEREARVPGLSLLPDLVATLGDRTILVEVTTGRSTRERDRVKQLRSYAEATPGTAVRVIEALQPFGAAGRRRVGAR